jgi:thiol-disulfide isomerase/thioredoxin
MKWLPELRRTGPVLPAWLRLGFMLVPVFAIQPAARADLQIGEPLPSLAAVTGEVPSTRGQVVLLDFWASWCAPCKASFPAFAALHRDFQAKGLLIIAVSVDEKTSAYESFIHRQAPPFTTLHDRQQALVRTVKIPAMPTSYLFGRDGRLRFIHQGFHGRTTADELRRQIEVLLQEPTAP